MLWREREEKKLASLEAKWINKAELDFMAHEKSG